MLENQFYSHYIILERLLLNSYHYAVLYFLIYIAMLTAVSSQQHTVQEFKESIKGFEEAEGCWKKPRLHGDK